jgi:hypothetical protein
LKDVEGERGQKIVNEKQANIRKRRRRRSVKGAEAGEGVVKNHKR